MIKFIEGIWHVYQVAFVLAVAYLAYVNYQYFLPGASVRISTNVDQHTPLNHGQQSVEITLPRGMDPTSFGGCSPHWYKHNNADTPKWHTASCDIEKFDPASGGFKPAPAENVWIEIKK